MILYDDFWISLTYNLDEIEKAKHLNRLLIDIILDLDKFSDSYNNKNIVLLLIKTISCKLKIIYHK